MFDLIATNPATDSLANERPVPPLPDFSSLMGRRAWCRLPIAVRRRFSHAEACDSRVVYGGTMQVVEATRLGRALAVLTGMFGKPIATLTGSDVPTVVHVYANHEAGGIVWERTYRFAGRTPLTVSSVKRLDADGELEEALGGGLSMALTIQEEAGVLTFRSCGYRLSVLGTRLTLPSWFPPGETRVTHRDLGNGSFQFTFSTHHPWFGRMFYQTGRFRRIQEVQS